MSGVENLDLHGDCRHCPLHQDGRFCDLSEAASVRLNAMKFSTAYPKGATLFLEGDEPRGVFIMCVGKAKLTTSSFDGKTLITKITEPGEILGASATILGAPYEISAETIEPSQVSFVRGADFLALLENHPDACLRAARQVSAKYHDAQREVRTFGLAHTTSEKLARLILGWAASGQKTARGVRIEVLLTHEEIGQMLGATRETVTRLLGNWKRDHIIDVSGANVYLTGPAALEAMVNC